MNTTGTLTTKKLGNRKMVINQSIVDAIIGTSVHLIRKLNEMNYMGNIPHTTVNIIIDTNCSLRKNKLRMRTIISCILITVIRELGISFNLFVFCGRYRGVYIPLDNRSIVEIISLLFDLEGVVKMPSTPLDLLTVKGQFDEKDPTVIVSDGFSEQLLSEKNEKIVDIFRTYTK